MLTKSDWSKDGRRRFTRKSYLVRDIRSAQTRLAKKLKSGQSRITLAPVDPKPRPS